ncbi:MAG: thiolase domain-containing protein [Nitrososphaerota archaeon]|nr:thiolase domain-containing protein [Nitrososphaerota archaeon]MDG6961581.1 thiolase domain-containing protein [Nitrososphaerota archaeon]MDG7015145.1 thiolase domain-containing protein [Nitrososphaerota archaeon]WGO49909.1 MAG: thiolase domain-containing protein [Nitrososphaerota archaeon]
MSRQKAYVASVGFTQVGDHWNKSLLDLAVEASRGALKGLGGRKVDQVIVGNMFSAVGASQEHLGALVTSALGLHGTPAFKVEAACASGSSAFNVGYNLVRSGAIGSALVVGVEKMRDLEPEEASQALAMAESAEYTQFVGATFAALNGLLARLYMEQEDVTRDELSAMPVLDHANAVTAAHAQFRKAIAPEVVSRSAMIADPLRLFDCAPVGDGAAATLIVNEDALSGSKGGRVEVLGGKIATNEFSVYEREDMLDFKATREAFRGAMAEAGLAPGKLSLVEVHDAFSVVGALSLEAMGFSERGHGSKDVKAGKYSRGGDLPINTFGGLKARGHPVGATGMYQIVEAFLQLTDQAGKNQVEGAKYAATQNIGGVDSTSAVHVFGRGS